ncbi:ATP-binding protein [Deinococcus humi]|uniref:Putative ATPase/DNA-binding SARP family transcriptional activator n=1 Tax=Deinococcus humi TaxID=662880 RepID=A0A7W8K007_9DEIO|nr:BTAD domain-containing putative transcriptional regulator [Deinococcus humi]MBB5366350.1 putative ATPase/DNA-binding SARP family transcriptional activator [Deinococcus humi]GGO41401.1 transcriptional activator [Deinococcus humi]
MTTSVSLLGWARAESNSQVTAFLPNKRYQLLAYLAYQGDWVDRERLADLFWPDSNPHTARSNLRQLLLRARTQAVASDLEVERQRVRWKVLTDVEAFTRAAEAKAWQEALSHYKGPLMDHLDGDEPGEFADWLTLERERLRGLRHTVLLRRAGELEGSGAPLEAAAVLQDLLADSEPDEMALRMLLQVQRQAGDHAGARKAYHSFVERLRTDFGLGLTAELEHLGRVLQQSAANSGAEWVNFGTGSSGPRHSLSTALTSFIGRDLELAEIQRLLSRSECRLLTLSGPGGIGKTRLALEAVRAHELQDPGGALFVPLETLASGTDVVLGLSDHLGLAQSSRESALETLIRHLSSRRLLVLDNFEHLLDNVVILPELLRRCPDLRLVVTSRERLGVAGEWLLPIGGLDYPATADFGPTHSRHFDAVQLFVERAGRVRPDFAVGDADLPHVLAICQLVDGSPLGLELAAVWARVLTLEDIAREIGTNLDFLSSAERTGTGRHRSLRAVFESSWRQLTPDEQKAFRQLAVFRGGFRLEAARWVAGVPLPVLAALVDKSLLRLSPRGRYDRHALLFQYAQELLAQDPLELRVVQERHGLYYLTRMAEWSQNLEGPGGEAARSALDEESGNILLAWSWGIEQTRLDCLQPASSTMMHYFDRKGRYQEGLAFYAQATGAITDPEPAYSPVLGEMLLRQAWFHVRLGAFEAARVMGERAMTLILPNSAAAQRGENFLGALARLRGDFHAAMRHQETSLALGEKNGDESNYGRAANLCHLAQLQTALGRLKEAGQSLDQLEGLGPLLSQPHATIVLQLARGYLFLTAGRLEEARASLEQGLALAQKQAPESNISSLLRNLATVACEQGAFEEAQHLGKQTLALAEAERDAMTQSAALNVLGRATAAMGRDQAARDFLARGLHLAWSIQEIPQVLEGLTYLAEARVLRGWPGAASPVLEFVLSHPSTYHRLKVLAGRLNEKLRPGPCPAEPAAEQGGPEQLQGMVTEGLTSLGFSRSAERYA